MKALVTGATGSVGRHLVRRLCEAGHSVRALVRPTSDVRTIEQVEFVQGDIRDPATLEQAIRGCAQVYHCAALASRMKSTRSDFHAINVVGTENVVRAAMKVGIERLVHVSTAGNFHNSAGGLMDENQTPQPNSEYRKTKLAAEDVVMSNFRAHRLPVVIARISSVYGPEQRNWLDLFRSISNGRFRLLGDGSTRKHMGYISDIVEGLCLCGSVPGIEGQAFFIAGPTPVTMVELTQTIASAMSVPLAKANSFAWPFRMYFAASELTYARMGHELPRAQRYSIYFEDQALDLTKAKTQLDFQPAVPLAVGIKKTLEWYRANGYL